jgi:hypothetical protein
MGLYCLYNDNLFTGKESGPLRIGIKYFSLLNLRILKSIYNLCEHISYLKVKIFTSNAGKNILWIWNNPC